MGSLGCASTLEDRGHDRVVVAVDPQPARASSEVEVTEVVAPPPMPEPPRRRLSQTVTLGQSEGGYAPPPQPAAGPGGPNVVVNNNVTVVNQPPVVYGGYGYGYGGYGHGGYGGYGNYGSRGTGSHTAWAPNGWEGAQRTAAPGQTPAVGGNFPAAPSSGPRQMK
jgi:hypothetical protein